MKKLLLTFLVALTVSLTGCASELQSYELNATVYEYAKALREDGYFKPQIEYPAQQARRCTYGQLGALICE